MVELNEGLNGGGETDSIGVVSSCDYAVVGANDFYHIDRADGFGNRVDL